MAGASSFGAATEVIPDPESCWEASEVTEATLRDLERRGLIGSKEALAWRAPEGHRIPCEDRIESVVFVSFFERGFGIPIGDFFHGLLEYYGIEVTHLNPNSILDITAYIHLCEAFLGIPPPISIYGGDCTGSGQ